MCAIETWAASFLDWLLVNTAGRVISGIMATLIMLPFEEAFPYLFRAVNLFRSKTLEEAVAVQKKQVANVSAVKLQTRDDDVKVLAPGRKTTRCVLL